MKYFNEMDVTMDTTDIDLDITIQSLQDLSLTDDDELGSVQVQKPASDNQWRKRRRQKKRQRRRKNYTEYEDRLHQTVKKKKKKQITCKIEIFKHVCRVCAIGNADILIMECNHVVICNNCLQHTQRCPVKHYSKWIKTTKQVFYN